MPGLLQAMTLAREGRFVLEVRETDAGKAQRQMQVDSPSDGLWCQFDFSSLVAAFSLNFLLNVPEVLSN
eukprot:4819413-Amphidinium_carterae.1